MPTSSSRSTKDRRRAGPRRTTSPRSENTVWPSAREFTQEWSKAAHRSPYLSSVGVDPGPGGGKPSGPAPPVHAKVGIAIDAARIQHEGACLPPGLADLRR